MTMGRSFFTAAQFGMTDTVRLRYSARREKISVPVKPGNPADGNLTSGGRGSIIKQSGTSVQVGKPRHRLRVAAGYAASL